MNIQTVKHNEISFVTVYSPQELELKYLRNTFGFDQLHLDDFVNRTQIPTVESYRDYSLVALDFPYFDQQHVKKEEEKKKEENDKFSRITDFLTNPIPLPFTSLPPKKKRIKTSYVNFFIGKDYLVVLHEETLPQINDVLSLCQKALRYREEFMGKGSVYLFYRIADILVDSSLVIINELSSTIDYIDKKLSEDRSPEVVEDISVTRRNLVVFQTMIKPTLPIFTDLEDGKFQVLNGSMTPYWGNILNHLQRIWERLEDNRELIEGISISNESLLTFRTNEIVKFLTVITAISFPFVIVNNLYSMNVAGLPYAKEGWLVWVLFGVIFCAGTAMILFFKYKKWI